ncbi:hypothetical protein ACQKWADRAFT_284980 [Trichoderma austrokoningii]
MQACVWNLPPANPLISSYFFSPFLCMLGAIPWIFGQDYIATLQTCHSPLSSYDACFSNVQRAWRLGFCSLTCKKIGRLNVP